MKNQILILAIALTLFMACTDVTSPARGLGATTGDGTTRVQYIVCGDAYGVSMAFCDLDIFNTVGG